MEEAMKWLTRERVKVDRVACSWLVKHFVDEDAEFVFVPPDKVMEETKRLDAIPYDVKNVDSAITARNALSKRSLKKYKLTDNRALVLLGKIVNGADTDNTLYQQPEGPGLEALAKAFAILITRTITRSMPRSGSFMTRSMLIARKWCGRESPTECLQHGDLLSTFISRAGRLEPLQLTKQEHDAGR
jgi:hypothetical protein